MNKKILITGASRGLGFYLAQKFLEDGEIVFAGVRDIHSENIKALLNRFPDRLVPVTLEVTDTTSINGAAKTVGKYTDTLDTIINNAAVHNDSSFEILERANIDDCLSTYDVNSLGPLRIVKAFLPFIRKGNAAKVVSITSESGSIGNCRREKEFDYCMSKAALNMGTKLLANYLRKDNIIVLAIHPGWMRTDMGGANAIQDPYETACQLVELIGNINDTNSPIFIDNNGEEYPW